ncbi:MAG TPA: glycosyltransferase family A protein [Candidatus Acidoferrum sp.]|nr:glycosyltransferase family A protein [Candidatus Acidoferrum sp.]
MPRPFVSVLVDTYNHERFIEQAIVSVLAQDLPAGDREIVVVDDGSTDGTPEIVRKFAPQVRHLRKQNGGQASAFNAGIPECRGDVIAFLDGDDWWAPPKLTAVVETFSSNPAIGLVGHGIIEVLQDESERPHLLREVSRFRLDSLPAAHAFRMRKSFLGTSRMAYRSELLRRIGTVPESLTIQADEFLFTVAGLFSEVVIRREPLTYYRLHDGNAFQVASGEKKALRRKYLVLEALARELQQRFRREGAAADITDAVVGSVRVEADLIRLEVESGFPWETISAEWRSYRIMHEDASPLRRALKGASLLPAAVLPARFYFHLRRRIAAHPLYRSARQRWMPFSRHGHLEQHSSEHS